MTLVVQVPINLTREAKEALRHYDDVVNGRATNAEGTDTRKKKGFMDKLKETFEE